MNIHQPWQPMTTTNTQSLLATNQSWPTVNREFSASYKKFNPQMTASSHKKSGK
jgi:hypothetical protein